VGREARDPSERKGRDECVLLLGRSHQEKAAAVDTLTMISHGVEISFAGGGADEKGGRRDWLHVLLYSQTIYCIEAKYLLPLHGSLLRNLLVHPIMRNNPCYYQ